MDCLFIMNYKCRINEVWHFSQFGAGMWGGCLPLPLPVLYVCLLAQMWPCAQPEMCCHQILRGVLCSLTKASDGSCILSILCSTNKTYLWVVSSVYRWLYIFSICLFCINCHFKTLMCLTVTAEDCLKEEFSIRCGEICVISLPSLKDIYVLFCCQTYAWYLSRCFKFKEEKPHSWAVTYSLFLFAAAPVTVVKAVCTAACKPEFPKLVWTFPALCLIHISTHGSFLPT